MVISHVERLNGKTPLLSLIPEEGGFSFLFSFFCFFFIAFFYFLYLFFSFFSFVLSFQFFFSFTFLLFSLCPSLCSLLILFVSFSSFSFLSLQVLCCSAVNCILTKQMVPRTIHFTFTFCFYSSCVFSINTLSPLLSASCPWLSVASSVSHGTCSQFRGI